MGYTRRQRLLRVELPLAVPLIIAGHPARDRHDDRPRDRRVDPRRDVRRVRPASSPRASRPFFPTEYLLGAVLSVVLAFAADFLLVRLERLITPWARARAGAALMDGIVDFFLDPANWTGTTGIPNRLIEHLVISRRRRS